MPSHPLYPRQTDRSIDSCPANSQPTFFIAHMHKSHPTAQLIHLIRWIQVRPDTGVEPQIQICRIGKLNMFIIVGRLFQLKLESSLTEHVQIRTRPSFSGQFQHILRVSCCGRHSEQQLTMAIRARLSVSQIGVESRCSFSASLACSDKAARKCSAASLCTPMFKHATPRLKVALVNNGLSSSARRYASTASSGDPPFASVAPSRFHKR